MVAHIIDTVCYRWYMLQICQVTDTAAGALREFARARAAVSTRWRVLAGTGLFYNIFIYVLWIW